MNSVRKLVPALGYGSEQITIPPPSPPFTVGTIRADPIPARRPAPQIPKPRDDFKDALNSLKASLLVNRVECLRIFRMAWRLWHRQSRSVSFPYANHFDNAETGILKSYIKSVILTCNSQTPYNKISKDTGKTINPLDLYGAFGEDGVRSRTFLDFIYKLVQAGCT